MDPEKSLNGVMRAFRESIQAQLTRIDADLQAGHIVLARARLKRILDGIEDWRIYQEITASLDEDLT